MKVFNKIQDKWFELQEEIENPFQRAAVVTMVDGEKRLYTGVNSHKKAYQTKGENPNWFVKVETYSRTLDRICAVKDKN